MESEEGKLLQKLMDEKENLSILIAKLEVFIMKNTEFQNIDLIQQSLLRIQLNSMLTYHQCLFERIMQLQN